MILDDFLLTDRVAIVTGAGRGLGAAIALGFAQAGADVVISARTQSELDDVAARIRDAGRRAHVVVADLANPDAAAELAGHAVEQFGKIDIVVNNVGGSAPKPLLKTSVADMANAFKFNVLNAHALVLAAVPVMLDSPGSGSIINIGSAAGRIPGRGFATYGTAKAALLHYTRIAAMDLSPRIRVNAIAPGAISTSALATVAADDAVRRPLERATPLRRIGRPEEIAAAAVYLASPAGAYLTGKVLEVDGGMIANNLELPFPDL